MSKWSARAKPAICVSLEPALGRGRSLGEGALHRLASVLTASAKHVDRLGNILVLRSHARFELVRHFTGKHGGIGVDTQLRILPENARRPRDVVILSADMSGSASRGRDHRFARAS
jgi:hypothetical protein